MRRPTCFAPIAALALLASTTVHDAHAFYGVNLLANSSADDSLGASSSSPIIPAPHWASVGQAAVVWYGASGGYPTVATPGPVYRGPNFFAGGTIAYSEFRQTVDVSVHGADIDVAAVHYRLAGYLGGYADQGDYAELTAQFLDGSGAVLDSASIGPVTQGNRGSATALLLRQQSGDVPPGTRSIRMRLEMTRLEGIANDGYADSLALVLSAAPRNCQSAYFKLDPRATYLRTNLDSHALPATLANHGIVDLNANGIYPGDSIRLVRLGSFAYDSAHGAVGLSTLGVFSSSSTLLAPDSLLRVPGAIYGSHPYVTAPTHFGGLPTDIPQDLEFSDSLDMTVRAGAAFLFLAADDEFYGDNVDSLYAVLIYRICPTAGVAGGWVGPRDPLALSSPWPNPAARGTASVRLELPAADRVTADVVDVTGRRVRDLARGFLPAGSHVFAWDGRDDSGRSAPAGVYFFRVTAGDRSSTKSFVLLR